MVRINESSGNITQNKNVAKQKGQIKIETLANSFYYLEYMHKSYPPNNPKLTSLDEINSAQLKRPQNSIN